MTFFNFQFWNEIEIHKNVLFHSNFKMKIEWHSRWTDSDYLLFFKFDYWIKKRKTKKKFLNLFWFKIKFSKKKIKTFEFALNFKKFFQFSILILKLKNEKWNIFKIRFVFKSKTNYKTIKKRHTDLVKYLNVIFRIEVKTKSNYKILN